ncbi:MAG: 4Fe-4S binding protein [Pirellulales bacterium]|nr:4Fe-4S binding protein [Pirellulales bacterium]
MVKRNIIQIDREKCDGCGLCVSACAEGAIQIRGGKAELVSDTYCDGLGACLGECPRGALTVVQREAEAFDQKATERHVAGQTAEPKLLPTLPCGCPGTNVQTFSPAPSVRSVDATSSCGKSTSALGHWPVQLHLVPPGASFLREADLLLVADCVPFALADFHERLLRDRVVVIGCPKLDDAAAYVDRLAAILTESPPRRLTVVHMEVPCCTGLVKIAREALNRSRRDIPLDELTVSVRGEVID